MKDRIWSNDKLKVSLSHVSYADGSGLYTVGHSKHNARNGWKEKPLEIFQDKDEDSALYAYFRIIFTGK